MQPEESRRGNFWQVQKEGRVGGISITLSLIGISVKSREGTKFLKCMQQNILAAKYEAIPDAALQNEDNQIKRISMAEFFFL